MSSIYLSLGPIKLQSPCGSDAMVKSTVALLEAQNRCIQVAEGAILTYVNQETRTIIDKFSPQIQAAADLALAQLAQLQSRQPSYPILNRVSTEVDQHINGIYVQVNQAVANL